MSQALRDAYWALHDRIAAGRGQVIIDPHHIELSTPLRRRQARPVRARKIAGPSKATSKTAS